MQVIDRAGERELAVVRGVYDAFARGDVARITELVASEVTIWQSPALPWGGEHSGHEGLGRFLTALTGALDSSPVTERLYADGAGAVVQVGRTTGTVRRTGVPFDVAETHVWQVRDGAVVRFEAYLDTAAMLAALERADPR